MDDLAASQQLLDEAHAVHATGKSDTPTRDATDIEEPQSLPVTPEADFTPSRQTAPSQPRLVSPKTGHSFTNGENETTQNWRGSPTTPGASEPSQNHDVEVPDSQLAVPMSSFAIPASVQEGQPHKKAKKRLNGDATTTNVSPGQSTAYDQMDTIPGTAELPVASSSQRKRKRKRSYATPCKPTTGWEHTDATSEQEASAMFTPSDILEAAATSTPQAKKKRTLPRKNAARIAPSASSDDDSVAVENSLAQDLAKRAKGKLRRIKKPQMTRNTESKAPQAGTTTLLNESVEVDRSPTMNTPQAASTDGNARERFPRSIESASASSKHNRRRKNTVVDARDSQALHDSINQSSSHATPQSLFISEDTLGSPTTSHVLPSTPSIQERTKTPARTGTPGRRYTRKSMVDTSIMAAERELSTARFLELPYDLPDSGNFTTSEDEILRRAIKDFQQRRNLDVNDLVGIIQWTDPSRYDPQYRNRRNWPVLELEEEQESKEFWDEIRNSGLKRTLDIIKKHVQARYHSFKSGAWTQEEDDNLKRLVEEYPNQWKIISIHMVNRSAVDILNRWKDYLQYGDNRNTSRWSAEEEESLLTALRTVIQQDEDERSAANLPARREYLNKHVKWLEVCSLMGNVRSRLQCTVKWTQMKTRDPSANIQPTYRRGRTPEPDQVLESRPKKSTKKRMRKRRSEDAEADPGITVSAKKSSQTRKSNAAAATAMPLHGGRKEVSVASVGISQMRWGDKADLVDVIAGCANIQSQEDIDWDYVMETMQNPWPAEVLQAALRQLLDLVEDQGLFTHTMMAIHEHLLTHIDHDELRAFYTHAELDPALDLPQKGKTGIDHQVLEELPTTKASHSTEPKNKKRNVRSSTATPRSVSSKKTKLRSLPPTPKSSEFVTESDDADDGQELQ